MDDLSEYTEVEAWEAFERVSCHSIVSNSILQVAKAHGWVP